MLDFTPNGGLVRRTQPSQNPSPMDAVVRDAANKLLGLKMARLVLEPEQDDLRNVLDDIEVLTNIFDGVIKALGEYAGDYFGLSREDIDQHFSDQLRSALEGNADFVLSEAMREIEEERANRSWYSPERYED